MPAPLGQHFLKNPAPARALVRALELTQDDVIVEVGPGHGELTRHLAQAPHRQIICVERDVRLAAGLVRLFSDDPSITVIHGDIRELLAEIATPLGDSWKIAGNIPYYLTSYLVRLMGELANPPSRAALLMQREVAERISAVPGSFTKLAAFTKAWADTAVVTQVPRTAFSPPPKVDSAILSFIRNTPVPDRLAYDAVCRHAFSQPRKVLLNNLAIPGVPKEDLAALLIKEGLSRNSRAQDLSRDAIIRLGALGLWR